MSSNKQHKRKLAAALKIMGTSLATHTHSTFKPSGAASKTLVYQVLPSRYGLNPDDLRRADALEVVVGQGAKPGGGGMLLGQKITPRVAAMRDLPEGIDQRSACRHPDWTGPDDLEIKILELREITDWRVPIYVKVGATRTYYDVALAVKAGADVVVVDGMQGGTAATQDVFIEHVGIPTLPAVRLAQPLHGRGVLHDVLRVVAVVVGQGAEAHLRDALHGGVQEVAVVGDEHDGSRVVREVLLEPVAGRQVEVVRGLVHEQQVRPRQKQLGERDAHLPAA